MWSTADGPSGGTVADLPNQPECRRVLLTFSSPSPVVHLQFEFTQVTIMTKPQVQAEVAVNGANEQDTSATAQRKPTKRLTKIRRVVKWSAAAGIVIYLIYVKFLGFGKSVMFPLLLYIVSPLGVLALLSVYFYEKKIAKITLGIIISIFILLTLFIGLLAFGLYIADD